MTQQAEILPMETGKVAVYNPFRAQLKELKNQNSALVFDYESPAGNKAARSHIHKLRLTKGAVEKARKEEKNASLEYGRKVDAEAKEITAAVDAMIDVHQNAVDAIEQREKDRVSAIQSRIADIKRYQECTGHDSQETASGITTLRAIIIDDSYGEFEQEARLHLELSLRAQEAEHIAAFKRETDARELERLRKEAAERAQRDREEEIRRQAAEKAKADAEAVAQRQIELAAREKADAERRAQQAEENCIAAEQAAKHATIAAAARAESEKQEAIQEERERAEAVKRAEVEAQAKRQADQAHRAKINNHALDALNEIINAFYATGNNPAQAIIEAIARGKIPHVSINY